MLTRCPACATHFRVTTEQLKARSGRVRCGECQQVFNALDSLIEEPILVITQLTPALPPQSLAAAFPDTVAEAPEELSALQQEPSVPESAEAVEPEATEPDLAEPEATEPEPAEPEAAEPAPAEPEEVEPEEVEPEEVEPEEVEPEEVEP